MPIVISTLLYNHDLRLVALAAAICALSAFAGVSLLIQARRSSQRRRLVWSAVAAVAVGFGIWATHFVAMLSFKIGMPAGYDLQVTLVSLGIAVLIVGAGLYFAAVGTRRSDVVVGGAVVGIGISAMHYIGMAALLLGGQIIWDSTLVASSLLLGLGLGAASLFVATHAPARRWRIAGAGLLTLAICAMHFTAMGAAGLSNCYPIVAPNDETPVWLSFVVAVASIFVLALALGAIYLERRRLAAEDQRMRGLADAAVEGLLVVKDDRVVTANRSLLALIGLDAADVEKRPIGDFFTTEALAQLQRSPDDALETDLQVKSAQPIPVEAILRRVDYSGTPHEVIAVRDLTARKQAEQRIRFLAHNDALTGLANRASFNRSIEDELSHARRLGQSFAVLAVDLDRFKEINDLFGHLAGDAVLRRIANVLRGAVGDRGICARLGGDEFAILLSDIGSPARAGLVAEAVLEIIDRESRNVDGPMTSVSIGIAIFPEDGKEAEPLLSAADTALYRAKTDGKGVYRFYEAEMGAQVRDRRLLEHDLRRALQQNELRLVYQPQVDVQTGEVTGFEALARWTHPTRGDISPGIFVPIAEETGLIVQIGAWVLRAAAEEAARWTAPLGIAVNVSPVQLHAPNFVQTVETVLRETGLPPARLEIEITETALVRDMARALSALQQVRALGVQVAMDDFGTGYSSLANLSAFPFSKIKVDQSFIRSVDRNGQSAAIVRAVLGLGSGLNIPVVAEGVERQEELDFLRNEICQTAQGYLLSRPQQIEAFHLLTTGATRRIDRQILQAAG